MNRLFPQLIVTLLAAGSLLSPAAAQVFDPGPSDPALFDSVLNIPADQNPLETSFSAPIAPDTPGGTKQVNVSDGGQVVSSGSATVDVESGVELNITGGVLDNTTRFIGPRYRFLAGSEANISGGTTLDGGVSLFQGEPGSLLNVTGGDYDEILTIDGVLNLSGGQFTTVGVGGVDAVANVGGDVSLDRLNVGGAVANVDGDANIQILSVGRNPFTMVDGAVNFMGGFAGRLFLNFGGTLNVTGGTIELGGSMTTSGTSSTLNVAGGVVQTIYTVATNSQANVSGGVVFQLHAGESDGSSHNANINVSGGTVAGITVNTPRDSEGASPNVATVTGGRVGTIAAEHDAQVRVSGGAVNQFNLEVGADVEFSGGEFMLNGAPYTEPSVDLITGDVFTGTLLDGSPFVYESGDFDGHITLDTQPTPPADLTPIVVDAPSDLYGLRAGQSLTLRDGGTLRGHFSMVNADLTIEGGAFGVGVSPLNGRRSKVAGSNILMTGGEVLGPIRLAGGSTFTMTGGTIDTLSVSADSVVNISGGTWDRFFGGPVNLFGSEFALDGVPIEDLIPGEPFDIPSGTGFFSGVLADGTSFSLNRNPLVSGGPFTVTLVEPGDFDFDGVVDGADFLAWQRDTSVGDLADWQASFGTSTSPSAATAVPEPTAVVLLGMGLAGVLSQRSRRQEKVLHGVLVRTVGTKRTIHPAIIAAACSVAAGIQLAHPASA